MGVPGAAASATSAAGCASASRFHHRGPTMWPDLPALGGRRARILTQGRRKPVLLHNVNLAVVPQFLDLVMSQFATRWSA